LILKAKNGLASVMAGSGIEYNSKQQKHLSYPLLKMDDALWELINLRRPPSYGSNLPAVQPMGWLGAKGGKTTRRISNVKPVVRPMGIQSDPGEL